MLAAMDHASLIARLPLPLLCRAAHARSYAEQMSRAECDEARQGVQRVRGGEALHPPRSGSDKPKAYPPALRRMAGERGTREGAEARRPAQPVPARSTRPPACEHRGTRRQARTRRGLFRGAVRCCRRAERCREHGAQGAKRTSTARNNRMLVTRAAEGEPDKDAAGDG
jgi:hypothetical protein